MIKCIYGRKVSDLLLRDEEGGYLSVFPDPNYQQNFDAFWMLKEVGNRWKILRMLGMLESEKRVLTTSTSFQPNSE